MRPRWLLLGAVFVFEWLLSCVSLPAGSWILVVCALTPNEKRKPLIRMWRGSVSRNDRTGLHWFGPGFTVHVGPGADSSGEVVVWFFVFVPRKLNSAFFWCIKLKLLGWWAWLLYWASTWSWLWLPCRFASLASGQSHGCERHVSLYKNCFPAPHRIGIAWHLSFVMIPNAHIVGKAPGSCAIAFQEHNHFVCFTAALCCSALSARARAKNMHDVFGLLGLNSRSAVFLALPEGGGRGACAGPCVIFVYVQVDMYIG